MASFPLNNKFLSPLKRMKQKVEWFQIQRVAYSDFKIRLSVRPRLHSEHNLKTMQGINMKLCR